jgi:hypothetical protein
MAFRYFAFCNLQLLGPNFLRYTRGLQKQNQQAHHDWATAHQKELQQLRVSFTQSTETILSSTSIQVPGKKEQVTSTVEVTTLYSKGTPVLWSH